MRRVKSRDTSPELLVRKVLREIGRQGYRLHRKDIPGKPDIAWIGRKKAIFIHGCFWHGHTCARGSREPKTRVEYWRAKIARNKERDERHRVALADAGWSILTIWECELNDRDALTEKLDVFFIDTSQK